MVSGADVTIEVYEDGEGAPFVILQSYGGDGGEDHDDITTRLVAQGWRVLRPQPRGIAGSVGPTEGLSLHDLAGDVTLCLRTLCDDRAVLLGHAF